MERPVRVCLSACPKYSGFLSWTPEDFKCLLGGHSECEISESCAFEFLLGSVGPLGLLVSRIVFGSGPIDQATSGGEWDGSCRVRLDPGVVHDHCWMECDHFEVFSSPDGSGVARVRALDGDLHIAGEVGASNASGDVMKKLESGGMAWHDVAQAGEEGTILFKGDILCIGECPPTRSGSVLLKVQSVGERRGDEDTREQGMARPLSPRKIKRHGRNIPTPGTCAICGGAEGCIKKVGGPCPPITPRPARDLCGTSGVRVARALPPYPRH